MPILDELMRACVQSGADQGRPHPDLWRRIQPHLAVRGQRPAMWRRRWFQAAAATAVCVIALTVPGLLRATDVAWAMAQAVGQLTSYHGVMEVSFSGPGAEATYEEPERIYVWIDGDRRVVHGDNVHNIWEYIDGDRIWRVYPGSRQVQVRTATSDYDSGPVDLQSLVQLTRKYPHDVVGHEPILGRQATKLVGTYPNGGRFTIWIDEKTNLPLQVERQISDGVIEKSKYLVLADNTVIDPEFFSYTPPDGWRLDRQFEGTVTATLDEAAKMAGFTPLTTRVAPRRIFVLNGEVTQDYGDGTVVRQSRQEEPMAVPFVDGVRIRLSVGYAADGLAYEWENAVTWVQNGLRVHVSGNDFYRIARELAPDLRLSDRAEDYAAKAQVKVPIDLEEARKLQTAADAGAVTPNATLENLVAAFAKVAPNGPPAYWMGRMVAGNGVQVVAEMPTGPYRRIYVKRLIRQDEYGLWFIVGYDPR